MAKKSFGCRRNEGDSGHVAHGQGRREMVEEAGVERHRSARCVAQAGWLRGAATQGRPQICNKKKKKRRKKKEEKKIFMSKYQLVHINDL